MRLHDQPFVAVEVLHENRQRADGVAHEPSVFKETQALALDFQRPVEDLRRGGELVLGTRRRGIIHN